MKAHEFVRASALPDYECNDCGLPPEHAIHAILCGHCRDRIDSDHSAEHRGLCCDCYDLSWGMPLDKINKERKAKGKPAILKPWPKSV